MKTGKPSSRKAHNDARRHRLPNYCAWPYNRADAHLTRPLAEPRGAQSMIRFQIIERPGANLYKTLVDAMRAGELRTFEATRRGRRIQHKNLSYPGWMNWSVHDGMINCEVISPRKPGREWQFFSAFLGRLADRYAGKLWRSISSFPARPRNPPGQQSRSADAYAAKNDFDTSSRLARCSNPIRIVSGKGARRRMSFRPTEKSFSAAALAAQPDRVYLATRAFTPGGI